MTKITLVLLCLIPIAGYCAGEGRIGMAVHVTVDGFFSRNITSLTVETVDKGSPADKAGISEGDKILAIEDCAIPGCPAKVAKKHMALAPGEVVHFKISKADGVIVPTVLTAE